MRDALITEHSGIVAPIARALAARLPPCFEFDDLYQAGMMGLLHAAEVFDPRRNDSFPDYAKRRVRGAMYDAVKGRNYDYAFFREINDANEPRAAASPELTLNESIDQAGVLDRVWEAFDALDARSRRVLTLHYLKGRTFESLEGRMGVTRGRLSQIHLAAIERLREELDAAA